jgi:D-glycerate 3-kinase
VTWLSDFMAAEALPVGYAETVERVCLPLAGRIESWAVRRPLMVGICGAQGSGKTTLAAVVARLLADRGLRVARLSLDDLYLSRAERAVLAREVHPLLAVRGVPGTHDVELGEEVLATLARAGEAVLPAFDKAADDRAPPAAWPRFRGPADLVLFEGWCVGARPQPPEALAEPVNDLERRQDPQGVWRAYVNDQLAGPYLRLFGRLDRLVLLQAPGFEVVAGWRREQERKLRARLAREGGDPARAMSEDQVAAFVAHYERLTRHILAEMPGRADLVVRLGADRRPLEDLS